jgi:hypothetical protein
MILSDQTYGTGSVVETDPVKEIGRQLLFLVHGDRGPFIAGNKLLNWPAFLSEKNDPIVCTRLQRRKKQR